MAVYTDVPAEALAGFLEAYDLGRATELRGITEGVENSNFLLATERDRFILAKLEAAACPRRRLGRTRGAGLASAGPTLPEKAKHNQTDSWPTGQDNSACPTAEFHHSLTIP